MSIRAARGDDFDAVTALLEALGRPPVTPEAVGDCYAVFEEQVLAPECHHMVYEEESRTIVGFCSLHFRMRLNHPTREAWIPDLFVAENVRLRGIGRALLEEAERRARDRGCHSLTLESGYRRAEAHHLYHQLHMRDGGKFFYKQLREHPAP